MTKFLLIYHGGKPPETPEEKDRVMAEWGKWFESLGDGLVDPGNPVGLPKAIGGEVSDPATGFSMIQADDHDAAVEMAKGNPMVNDDGTRIEVYETFSM